MSGVAGLFGVEGRTACVTGTSSGLGRAVARALAEAGARVVGVARRAEALEDRRAETRGETAAVPGDLGDPGARAGIAARAAEPFGPPAILVDAAGVNRREPADEVSERGWRETIEINLSAPFFLARALVPAMRAAGWGRIADLASLQTSRAFPDGIAYGASKDGVGQLTRAMAEARSRHGVTADALAPGFFPTGLTGPALADPALAALDAGRTCIGCHGDMADIVGPAPFPCSEASGGVTGRILHVDGGTAR